MTNLSEFLNSVGAKPTSKQSEWLMECWECGQNKLYFNIDKVIGYCVKCDRTRTLFDIAKTVVGISLGQIQEFIDEHRVAEFRQGSFRDSMIEGLLGGKSIQAESQLVEMHWPDGYRSLEDGQSSVQGKKALAYLLGRGFKKEVLYEMQFGYCATGFYSGRIIIPTFIDGRLVYWQARDYTGRKSAKDKILNPRSGLVGNGKSEVLFNYDTARQYDCVIVVESWGSCLSVGPYGTAVNGKHISQQQLRLLGRMEAKRFIVLFDYGVGAMSGWDAAEALNAIKPTSVALLPWGDPNEVPASVRNESIRSCIPYSKAAHVRYRLEQLGQSYK